MKFKIGDKVVPISKSFGKPFEECCYWKMSKEENQNFLYICGTYKKDYICRNTNECESEGNYYSETDLMYYKHNLSKLTLEFNFGNEVL
jgi:hypothetical protein